MRTVGFLFIIFLLAACSQNIKTNVTSESKFKYLLTKYKDISFDTLQVFSSDNNYADTFKFSGMKLDSASIALFPTEIKRYYGPGEDFFACFKFAIDSSRIGLITRTPSTYESSSIKLMILDKHADSITQFIELSEMVGDAGDSYTKDSWLFKKDNAFQVFGWIQEGHDNSVDNDKDTTTTIDNMYYLIKLSKAKIDTISEDKRFLESKFEKLIRTKGI